MMTAMPWSRINEFLLECGEIRHPRDFGINLLKKMGSIVPFDHGLVLFFNNAGSAIDGFSLNIEPRTIHDYKEYYYKVADGRYSISANNRMKGDWGRIEECVCDWRARDADEFVTDYMRPQGVHYTFDLALYDADNTLKSSCILNRTGRGFSDMEMGIMATLRPHLRNLYRNFFFNIAESGADGGTLPGLTARESEISALLCKGLSPALVGQKLFISQTTVYKHIANIHKKLAVSSRQELLVKLYNSPARQSGCPRLP